MLRRVAVATGSLYSLDVVVVAQYEARDMNRELAVMPRPASYVSTHLGQEGRAFSSSKCKNVSILENV